MSKYQIAAGHSYGVALPNGDVEWHEHPDVIELDPDAIGVADNVEAGNLIPAEEDAK